jgi:hypothetical protein
MGFISGWALECFGGNRLERCPLTTFPATEGNERYLATMAGKIRDGTRSPKDLSPFEEKDDEYRATFLNSPDLGMAPIDACDQWIGQLVPKQA